METPQTMQEGAMNTCQHNSTTGVIGTALGKAGLKIAPKPQVVYFISSCFNSALFLRLLNGTKWLLTQRSIYLGEKKKFTLIKGPTAHYLGLKGGLWGVHQPFKIIPITLYTCAFFWKDDHVTHQIFKGAYCPTNITNFYFTTNLQKTTLLDYVSLISQK